MDIIVFISLLGVGVSSPPTQPTHLYLTRNHPISLLLRSDSGPNLQEFDTNVSVSDLLLQNP